MKHVKIAIVALAVAIFAMVGVGEGAHNVQAHAPVEPPPHPMNIRAMDGTNSGEAILSWDAAAGVTAYRVGWLADADLKSFPNTWRQHFAYSDVSAASQWTLRRLTPGLKYHFIVGRRYGTGGEVSWPDGGGWGTLTLRHAPAVGGNVPAPVLTLPAAPIGGDYDADDDGLIEIRNLDQLNAVRHDLDGNGNVPLPEYGAAFPGAVEGMGCPGECAGYELAADLNFDTNGNGQADAGDAYWNNGEGWVPIGGTDFIYSGDFDGNSYTIANLYISRGGRDSVGLFQTIAEGSNFRNLALAAVDVTGQNYVGGLVGWSNGSINRSSVAGAVTGVRFVGGMVGQNYVSGNISNSYATADVIGDRYVGGLAGSNNGRIVSSSATGNVTGNRDVGSLVGYNSGSIVNSQGTGSVN